MFRRLLPVVFAACSSAAPPPAAAPAPASHPVDAAVDVAVDAPDPAASAPPWVFRYATKDRTETWTLRFTGGRALLAVEAATGTMHYTGTSNEGASIAIDVTATTARVTLDCKHTQRKLGAKCNTGKPVDVLDCYVPDIKTPMPFAPAPGVEYVSNASCTGYRLISP